MTSRSVEDAASPRRSIRGGRMASHSRITGPWLARVDLRASGAALEIRIASSPEERDGPVSTHLVEPAEHQSWSRFFGQVADLHGTRRPRPAQAPGRPGGDLSAVLTRNLTPDILYGYGDPAVTRCDDAEGAPCWWLYVTSNDAPNAFPILSSDDLETWRSAGFVFPAGSAPDWAMTEPGQADFWAPEMHQVNGECWVCFAARRLDGELAVGIARGPSPQGPFRAPSRPLLAGGVIDPHIFVDPEGSPYLVWKEDTNDRWPPLVAQLALQRPDLVASLFEEPADRRTALLCSRLLELRPGRSPMESFFILQPMIDAAADDFPAFRRRLSDLVSGAELPAETRRLAAEALGWTRTAIRAQPLDPESAELTGESTVILENDLAWEAHLVEGPWVTRMGDAYVLLYAANDFSTDRYGVGWAVADHPLGPYRKAEAPLLQSTSEWLAPGHPSVTKDANGRATMFLHGFEPGRVGYKAFRALLSAPLSLEDGRLRLAERQVETNAGDAPGPQLE